MPNPFRFVTLISKFKILTGIRKKLWLLFKLRPFLAVITALIVIILIASPFFYNIYWSQKDIPAINAIPNDAALILKINNLTQSWPLITKSLIWKTYTRETAYAQLESKMNRFLKFALQNAGFASAIKKYPLYISLHPLHEGGAGLLYTFQTGHSVHNRDLNPIILKYFGSKIQIVIQDFAGVSIRKIIFNKSTVSTNKVHDINLVYLQGIMIASENMNLIDEAILMLQSGESITNQPAFKQVSSTESSKANAVLYINYHNVPALLNKQLNPKSLFNISGISSFCNWTELDILIKEKEILMNGFSSAGDSSNAFLSLFNDQQTQPSAVDSLLPGNTAGFINISFKDYKTIFRRYKRLLKAQSKLGILENKLKAISDSFNINAEQTLTGWIKSEMGVAITNNLSLTEDENVYAYFKTGSPGQAEASLSILAKNNSMLFNGITIHLIEYPSLLPLIYGKLFPSAQKNYFAIAGEYVVFARSVNAMTAFLSNFTSKNTLSTKPSFQNFKNFISGNSNIWVYSDLPEIIRHISTLLIPGDKQQYPIMHALRSAKLISAEFSLENKLFYTSICIDNDTNNQTVYAPLTDEQLLNQPAPEWASYIGNVQCGPTVVTTGNKSSILLIDGNNKIWCFNEKGEVEWSHITGGHILGEMRIIDFQGHKSIAFNSSELLYLLNINGEYETGFPLNLPFKSTNGLTSYSASKEGLTFFMASSNNYIQAITYKGKKPEWWTPVEMRTGVIKPVDIIDHNGRKLITIIDVTNRIKITDLKGISAGNFDKTPILSSNTQVCPNRMTAKGDIICAATDGDLLFIKKNGTFDILPFETVITNPFFLLDQFDNLGKPDYIFIDQARLTVFNQQREIIYEYNLSSFPRFQPFIFTALNNRKYYLITSGNGRLLLFDTDGIIKEFPSISSERPPSILSIAGTSSVLILTVEKQILNAYKYSL